MSLLKKKTVQCKLCPKECRLIEGRRGDCRVRVNIGGKLITLVYGKVCAAHIDPIEKKPIFHMLPGTPIFSIATAGCNLHCKFCQNWEISQVPPEKLNNTHMPPEVVVSLTKRYGCPSIAYTYTEPVIFYEFVRDTAILARESGLKNVLVTAGFINEKPLRELCKYVDASNTDLKAFNDEYYRKICYGRLRDVLNALVIQKEEGVLLEVTNLILPTLNDSEKEIREMCRWIVRNLGSETPLHFSRFYPMFKMLHLYPTPEKTLERAREIALEEGLKFVYVGNVPGTPSEWTYCPSCKKVLIKRSGYAILENNIINGRCSFCGEIIYGVWA